MSVRIQSAQQYLYYYSAKFYRWSGYTGYSQTSIYRASIYRARPFTGDLSLPPNTGFMFNLM